MSIHKISIIVINFNSTKALIKLLNSVDKIKKIIGEIILIDNNSTHFNASLIPLQNKTKLVINDTNIGFAKAVNQGIDISKYKYILLLNPDTKIIDNSIVNLYQQILTKNEIGAIGGKIISKNQRYSANKKPNFLTGIFEFTNIKKIFPNNKFSTDFWPEIKNPNKKLEVDSLCGAFILFKKYLNKHKLKFDENFFLYLEDIDFGLNIREMGYKIIFDPKSKIYHTGGVSNTSQYNTILKYWYRSRKYFFKKHLNTFEGIIITIIFNIEERILSIYHHFTHTPNE